MLQSLSAEMASQFARIILSTVTREYPNKMDHVITGPADVKSPRVLHPIFYGSFDWHSCVHGYWLLSHLYRLFPALPESSSIRSVIEEHFTDDNVSGELDYLNDPARRSFERPYGIAWFLMLSAELAQHSSGEGRLWFNVLSPLTEVFVDRLYDYLDLSVYPVRSGAHYNSAFALSLAMEYARICRDDGFGEALRKKSRSWFLDDVNCAAWEPDGEGFLSPALIEALCMSRALVPAEFSVWLRRFLPRIAAREPQSLFRPAMVKDRTDPRIVHLDGLNLSRAWCWKTLANSLDADDPRYEITLEVARCHLGSSLKHIANEYVGRHWLATFATLALEA